MQARIRKLQLDFSVRKELERRGGREWRQSLGRHKHVVFHDDFAQLEGGKGRRRSVRAPKIAGSFLPELIGDFLGYLLVEGHAGERKRGPK